MYGLTISGLMLSFFMSSSRETSSSLVFLPGWLTSRCTCVRRFNSSWRACLPLSAFVDVSALPVDAAYFDAFPLSTDEPYFDGILLSAGVIFPDGFFLPVVDAFSDDFVFSTDSVFFCGLLSNVCSAFLARPVFSFADCVSSTDVPLVFSTVFFCVLSITFSVLCRGFSLLFWLFSHTAPLFSCVFSLAFPVIAEESSLSFSTVVVAFSFASSRFA